jgi:hypothetical protein
MSVFYLYLYFVRSALFLLFKTRLLFPLYHDTLMVTVRHFLKATYNFFPAFSITSDLFFDALGIFFLLFIFIFFLFFYLYLFLGTLVFLFLKIQISESTPLG